MPSVWKKNAAQILIPALGGLCLTPWMPSAAGLLLGISLAVLLGNPYSDWTRKHAPRLLSWSVMGLGAGMNLNVVVRVGMHGFAYTAVGIAATLVLGFMLAKLWRVDGESAILISVGTAICGGSAIAAIAPTIRAKPHSISVALGTVFLLNSVALVVFPWIGHLLALEPTPFGLWSALAIHDTSSVVGASMQFGGEALHVGTTVKLARALWIVPLALAASALYARRRERTGSTQPPKRPWFILGFVIAAAIVTWIPATQAAGHLVETVAKRGLVLTLFFIGANLTLSTLKSVGWRPLIHGFLLWIIVASATLGAVLSGLIS